MFLFKRLQSILFSDRFLLLLWKVPLFVLVYRNGFKFGFEFGFGAEIGISTQKLHARGPMALPELTSYKYLITGNGQIRG